MSASTRVNYESYISQSGFGAPASKIVKLAHAWTAVGDISYSLYGLH